MWVFFREAKRVLNLDIVTDGPAPDAHPGVPILVCCRHAGPGRLVRPDPRADALVRARAARRPQGHARLGPGDRRDAAPDPGPVHHARPGGGRGLEEQIAELATGLDENDAFVIFPEGGNFTESRRASGHRPAAQAGPGPDGRAGGGDDQRARARGPGGLHRRPRRRAGRRRRPGGAHRPRPHAHGRRHLARAADGQADHHALVEGRRAPRSPRTATSGSTGCSAGGSGSTSGSRRTGPRLASLPRTGPVRPVGTTFLPRSSWRGVARVGRCRRSSAGSSGVVTGCGSLGRVGDRLVGRRAGPVVLRPASGPAGRGAGRASGRRTTASCRLVAALQLLGDERRRRRRARRTARTS